jgi:tetratricopeptide (TPR) repeat protein
LTAIAHRAKFSPGAIEVSALEARIVERIHRCAGVAAGILLLVAATAPTTAMAQRARSTVFVAVTFHSPGDPKLGIDVGEEIRQRMLKFFPKTTRAGQVRIITREEINGFLTGSGYAADSAISTTDLRELGKTMGADESLEGTATRTAAGIEVKAHFFSLNYIAAPEVMPVAVGKDAGDAAKQLVDAYIRARKELPDYQTCRNGLINNALDQAVPAAKAALVQYDKGVLPRACLMGAYFKLYQAKKMAIDSTIRVGQEILGIDADNELAIGQLADAYMLAGDTTKAIQMNLRLYRMNSSNVAQAQTTIQILASSGAPDQAIPIVRDLLANNPGDVGMLDTYWKLLQATKAWKEAIAAGEEMVKADSTKADSNYFNRQIAAAIADSQPAVVVQFLGKATMKFPKNTRYWLGYSQWLRRQGQLQQSLDAAKTALAIDPKIDGGYTTVLSLYAALGQPDSTMAFAKTALAAGADKAVVGAALLPLIRPALTKAQLPDAPRSDWEELYRISATVDSLAPTPNTAFYMSFAAYTVGTKALSGIVDLSKTDKPKACAENKLAADMFTVIDLNMARGGRVEPTAAANILNALGQYKPYIEQYKKTIPCK